MELNVDWPLGGTQLVPYRGGFAVVDGNARVLVAGPDLADVQRLPLHTKRVASLAVDGDALVSSCSEQLRRYNNGSDRVLAHGAKLTPFPAVSGGDVYFNAGDVVKRWRGDDVADVAKTKLGATVRASPATVLVMNNELRAVDLASGKVAKLAEVVRPERCGFVCVGERTLAWAASSEGGGRIYFYEAGKRAPLAIVDVGNAVHAIGVSPNESRMVAGSPTHGAQVIDLAAVAGNTAVNAAGVRALDVAGHCVAVADDGRVVAVDGNTVNVFDADARARTRSFNAGARVHAAAASALGCAVGVGDGFTASRVIVEVWG